MTLFLTLLLVLVWVQGCKQDNRAIRTVKIIEPGRTIILDCGKDGVTIPYADEKTGLIGPLLKAGCKVVEEKQP